MPAASLIRGDMGGEQTTDLRRPSRKRSERRLGPFPGAPEGGGKGRGRVNQGPAAVPRVLPPAGGGVPPSAPASTPLPPSPPAATEVEPLAAAAAPARLVG